MAVDMTEAPLCVGPKVGGVGTAFPEPRNPGLGVHAKPRTPLLGQREPPEY